MDTFLTIAFWLVQGGMAGLGAYVSLRPQPNERHTRLIVCFIVLFLLGGTINIVQTRRSSKAQEQLKTQLDTIQRNTQNPPKVTVENKIDTAPLAGLFHADKPTPVPSATPKESPNSLRRRTMRLVNELAVFWSQRPVPPQPIQNPTTDEERKRNAEINAASEKYWREAKTAYLAANYRERLVGLVREYKSKGVPTGRLEDGFDQPERLVGSAPFGGSQLDDCMWNRTELCQLRELAYHVDANDRNIDLPVDKR